MNMQTANQAVHVNFPFIVTWVRHESEVEGDYDTAVDIVTSDITQSWVSIETPYGLKISLEQTTIVESHSYLEPDFDEVERSGAVHYLTLHDPDRDATRVYRRAMCSLPIAVPMIRRNDYGELLEAKAAGIELPSHFPEELGYLPVGILTDMKSNDFEDNFFNLPDNVIDSIVDASGPSTTRQISRAITVSLPVCVAKTIKAAEERLRTRRVENFHARIHNKAEIALYDLLGWQDRK